MNLACWSRMAICWALSLWRRMVLSSVIAAVCSVAFSNAPSKLLVYSRSEWWLEVDKAELMLGGTCGGLLDARLPLSKNCWHSQSLSNKLRIQR